MCTEPYLNSPKLHKFDMIFFGKAYTRVYIYMLPIGSIVLNYWHVKERVKTDSETFPYTYMYGYYTQLKRCPFYSIYKHEFCSSSVCLKFTMIIARLVIQWHILSQIYQVFRSPLCHCQWRTFNFVRYSDDDLNLWLQEPHLENLHNKTTQTMLLECVQNICTVVFKFQFTISFSKIFSWSNKVRHIS